MYLIYQLKPPSVFCFLKILQETLFSLFSTQYEYKTGLYHLPKHHKSFWEDDKDSSIF